MPAQDLLRCRLSFVALLSLLNMHMYVCIYLSICNIALLSIDTRTQTHAKNRTFKIRPFARMKKKCWETSTSALKATCCFEARELSSRQHDCEEQDRGARSAHLLSSCQRIPCEGLLSKGWDASGWVERVANLFQKEVHGVTTSRFRPAQGLFQLRHGKTTLYADELQTEHCSWTKMSQE